MSPANQRKQAAATTNVAQPPARSPASLVRKSKTKFSACRELENRLSYAVVGPAGGQLRKAFPMPQKTALLVLAVLLQGLSCLPASAAEREDVRKVVNLVTSVKMPYPESLTRNRAKTERVWLERGGGAT